MKLSERALQLFLIVSPIIFGGLGTALICSSQVLETPAEDLLTSSEVKRQPPVGPINALNKADLETYLRHLYVWIPDIQVEIEDFEPSPIDGLLQTKVRLSYKLQFQERAFYVTKDGQQILDGSAYTIDKNPFQSNLEKITIKGQPSFGTPGAPVVVVAYSDFQCPYCAKEAKVLRTQLIANYPEQVRVYFRDYPLITHNWAMDAAIAGRCIHHLEPAAFWLYHDWIFEHQEDITPVNLKGKVIEFATGEKLDTLKLGRCMDNRETEKEIQESKEEGISLGVRSTPTFFINGRPLTGVLEWERLKQILDNEVAYQKVANNAGDDCGCEVTIPIP